MIATPYTLGLLTIFNYSLQTKLPTEVHSLKIQDFKATDQKKQECMDAKLKEFKLEDVLSLWYFVVSKNKSTIVGSKD